MYSQLTYSPTLNLWKHDFLSFESLYFRDLINNIKTVKVRYDSSDVINENNGNISISEFTPIETHDIAKFEFVDFIQFNRPSTEVSVDYTFERKIDRLDLDISGWFEKSAELNRILYFIEPSVDMLVIHS